MLVKHGTESQIKEIYDTFRLYKDIFPHLRFDYLTRKVKSDRCIYEDDVAITYTIYQRKNKVGTSYENLELKASKGDVMIHQLANANPSNGKSKEIVQRFLEENCHGKRVWLTVRQNNDRAVHFYEKMNFENVGTVHWMKGKLPGYVFCYVTNKTIL